jgi:RNA polymerase sigma factor (sigma-70 family)
MSERTATTVLDEYLVLQSQLGDAAAFARLVRRWQARIVRHAHSFTRDAEAAKDVAQESWMAIVRGLRALHDPAHFRAWALRIVSNKARDWVRREGARRRAARGLEAELATGVAGAPAGALERVRASLAALEPGQRLILRCFYLEEMSVREIARTLDIPAGTVKSRLFHARNALRARLEEA